ncbi:CBS domain-containing protein [Aestuariicella hydrocarbonica]|uniref:CBS domain-containing protein n=1 Tax=Pseudomaricurvus hydrocarbonicus TaxID=1470433 RepID=A0A9E5JU61_9GAMM|nr:CBS domain-containing protein [Aestuariicella hydrocarbonica]NHO66614.1 CBS domain-containing protein [Aestuariicella hydrocarbonica]
MKTDLCAQDIMTPHVLMAYEGWSIRRLSGFFMKNKISGAPVIASDHSLVGVVTVTDILSFETKSCEEKSELLQEVYAEYVGQTYDDDILQTMMSKADENCTVNQVMTRHVIKVDGKAGLQEVAYIMLQHGIRRIFVTENGLICGVISTHNILTAIAQ